MDFQEETSLFLDIETTGLTPDVSAITVIGCMDFSGCIHQWFNADGFSQKELLSEFFSFLKEDTTLITFNGATFDVPFLNYKTKEFHLPTCLDHYRHYDLYRMLLPYGHLFPVSSLRQQSLEQYLDFPRQDTLSGRQLIKQYQSYLVSKDSRLKETILRHNEEDLRGLMTISSLLCYQSILDGLIHIEESHLHNDFFELCFSTHKRIPKEAYFQRDQMKLTMTEHQGILRCPLEHGTLKHYHPNPKDYYYLPKEDIVVPKSLGTFVEKTARLPADTSHCYSKFQPSENFLSDTDALYTFCKDTIYYLLRKD